MRINTIIVFVFLGLAFGFGGSEVVIDSLFMSQRTNSFIVDLDPKWPPGKVRLVNRLQGGPGIADEVRVILTERETGQIVQDLVAVPVSPGIYHASNLWCVVDLQTSANCSINVRITNNGVVETVEFPLGIKMPALFAPLGSFD